MNSASQAYLANICSYQLSFTEAFWRITRGSCRPCQDTRRIDPFKFFGGQCASFSMRARLHNKLKHTDAKALKMVPEAYQAFPSKICLPLWRSPPGSLSRHPLASGVVEWCGGSSRERYLAWCLKIEHVYPQGYIFSFPPRTKNHFIEGGLEVEHPTICTDERQRWEE